MSESPCTEGDDGGNMQLPKLNIARASFAVPLPCDYDETHTETSSRPTGSVGTPSTFGQELDTGRQRQEPVPLFGSEPIKLLSGRKYIGLESISRVTRRAHASAGSSGADGGGGGNSSGKGKIIPPSALLALQVADPKKWFLAISTPSDSRVAETVAEAEAEAEEGDEAARLGSGARNSIPPPSALAIEERISLGELRRIMEAFADDEAVITLTSTTASPVKSRAASVKEDHSTTSSAVAIEAEDRQGGAPWASAARLKGASAPASPAALTELLMRRDSLGRPIHHRTYNRELPQEAFVELMQEVVQSATQEEILELLNKVDYEAKGHTTWNELATFLVSQSQHRTHMQQANFAFVETPDPPSCQSHCLHQQATCFAAHKSKKLLVTGGSEGNVHAWGLTTLAYRGLLFTVKEWIVGLHFGDQGRMLYVVTMNRQIFTIDANSFEVLRVFRGRPVDETSVGAAYAAGTMRSLRVGGVKPPKEVPETVAAAKRRLAKEAKKRDQLLTDMIGNKSSIAASGSSVITTGMACDTLNVDNTKLTGKGRGPYVQRTVVEGVLAGLVSPVTASGHNYTRLQEEAVLLGTADGEIFIYVMPTTSDGTKRVIAPLRTLSYHTGQINKLAFVYSLEALLSCSDDGTVKMTSMVNGEVMRVFTTDGPEAHATVRDFDVHPELKMLVTMGSERHGLVWEFSQESPIAVLDEHTAPGRCCVFFRHHKQVVTTASDGSVHVFDISGFHLAQTLHLPPTHAPTVMGVDEVRQCLLCARRYPYHLRVKRQAMSSACPAKYTGHVAPMLTSLYTRTFDLIVTVDAEATAMTWARKNGKNIFVFPLNDFSDSTTIEATRITCASLDALQRRLLTGFRNGAVVVWNVVNGQAINFITAAMSEEEVAALAPTEKEEETKRAQSSREKRPWQCPPSSFAPPLDYIRNQRKASRAALRLDKEGGGGEDGRPLSSSHQGGSRPGSGAGANGGEAAGLLSAAGSSSREVTALGSLVRHGVTFIIFAVRNVLHTVRESTNFTVASARTWHMPEVYGEILTLMQVNPQMMACGTSSGALLFYHVLSETQDGAALWVKEVSFGDNLLGGTIPDRFSGGGGGGLTSPRRSSGGGGALHGSSSNLNYTYSSPMRRSVVQHYQQQQQGLPPPILHNVTARITRIIPLLAVSPNMILSVHADGTVALWQTFRRTYLGMVNLTSAGVDEGKEGSGTIVVDVDDTCQHLVFTDDGGNVHVCRLRFRALTTTAEEHRAMSLPNPALVSVAYGSTGFSCRGSSAALRTPRNRSMRDVSVLKPSEAGGRVGAPAAPAAMTAATATDEAPSLSKQSSCGEISLRRPSLSEEDEVSHAGDKREEGEDGDTINGNSYRRHSSTVTAAPAAQQPTPERVSGERVGHTFDSFTRTLVFGTGMTTIVSIIIVSPKSNAEREDGNRGGQDKTKTHAWTTAARTEGQDKAAAAAEGAGEQSEEGASSFKEPIIICTSKENYTRAFTMRGEPIGDLGMDTYDLQNPETYTYFGALVTQHGEHLPSSLHYASDSLARFDYLEEALIAQQQQQQQVGGAFAGGRRGRGRSLRSANGNNSVTSGFAGTVNDADVVQRASSTVGPSQDLSPPHGPGAPLPPSERVALASQLRAVTAKSDVEAVEEPAAVAADGAPFDQQQQQQISTLIKKSTKQRFLENRRYHGIVKQCFADQVHQQASALVTVSAKGKAVADSSSVSLLLGGRGLQEEFARACGGSGGGKTVDDGSDEDRPSTAPFPPVTGATLRSPLASSLVTHKDKPGGVVKEKPADSSKEVETLINISFGRGSSSNNSRDGSDAPQALKATATQAVASTPISPALQRLLQKSSASNQMPAAAAETRRRSSVHPSSRPKRNFFFSEQRPSSRPGHSITRPGSGTGRATTPAGARDDAGKGSSAAPRTADEVLRRHLEGEKNRLLSTALTDKTQRVVDREMKATEDRDYTPEGGDTSEYHRVNAQVAAVLLQQRRQQLSGAAAAQNSARSYCAQVAQKMIVLPVDKVVPSTVAGKFEGSRRKKD